MIRCIAVPFNGRAPLGQRSRRAQRLEILRLDESPAHRFRPIHLSSRRSVLLRFLLRSTLLVFLCVTAGLASVDAWGELPESDEEQPAIPLRDEIDRLVEHAYAGSDRPIANDAQFVRRVYLDLVGVIPTADEARAFLENPEPNKRERLVDELLNDPRFDHHMANVIDIMIMERRPDKHIPRPEWESYLLRSMQGDKPLNQLAHEILSADGVDAELRPAAKFYLDREVEPNLLTRDVGRVFFGVDLQCAQCHDHPHIDTYYQSDYFGIYSFVHRGFLFTDTEKKVFYAEKGEGDVEFTSIFTGEQGNAVPRIPYSDAITDPTFADGRLYEVEPADNVRPIPRYSRRLKMAELATNGENAAFNENFANRWWAHMMGRGLVHPVDLHHDENPATHPELLRVLGQHLADNRYDLSAFLREIALSQTYQRSYDLPTQIDSQLIGLHHDPAAIDETLAAVEQQLTAVHEQIVAARTSVGQQRPDFQAAETAVAEAKSSLDAQLVTQTALESQRATLSEQMTSIDARLVVFQDAVDAATTAMESVEDEPVLSQAHSVLLARLTSVRDEKENIAQQLAAVEQELAETRSVVAQAQATLDARLSEFAPIQGRYDQTIASYESLKSEHDQLAEEQTRIIRQKTTAKLYAELIQAEDALAAAAIAVNTAQTALAPVASQREELNRQHTVLAAHQMQLESEIAQTTVVINQALASEEDHAARLAAFEQLHVATVSGLEISPQDELLQQTVALAELRLSEIGQQQSESVAIRDAATEQRSQLQAEFDRGMAMLDEIGTKLESIDSRHAELAEQLTACLATHSDAIAQVNLASEALVGEMEDRLVISSLRPLSPEQLGWSMLTATGMVDANRRTVITELEQSAPITDEQRADEAWMRERANLIETQLKAKLQGSLNLFVSLFANAAGQPQDVFFATVEQTLFLKNGSQIRGWIASGGDSPRARALAATTAVDAANEIYLSVLTRYPTEAEAVAFADEWNARADNKNAVIQEWMWGLITSDEFRFNH